LTKGNLIIENYPMITCSKSLDPYPTLRIRFGSFPRFNQFLDVQEAIGTENITEIMTFRTDPQSDRETA